jgi:hypothetical protein
MVCFGFTAANQLIGIAVERLEGLADRFVGAYVCHGKRTDQHRDS